MTRATIASVDGRFELQGEMGYTTVIALLAESRSTLFAAPPPVIELDLAGVSRADSAGLALLLEWMRMAVAAKCEIRFHHLPEQLQAIASAGELETLLPVAD